MAYMLVRCIAHKLARTNLAESYTRTMVRVDVGSNLEDKSGEFRFVRFHFALFGVHGTGAGRNLHEAVQQFLHTEVVQCRAEEYGSAVSCQVRIYVESGIDAFDQFEVAAQLVCQRFADLVVQFFGMDVTATFSVTICLEGW